MKLLQYSLTALVAVTVIVLAFVVAPVAADETYRLPNGMEVILKPNHSAPMVASLVFVRSGSKYESTYENGITHFLEHLLFDGTTHLTRQQLDQSIRDLGGYINAFTQKDLTGYLVLLPRQYADYGMAVQADMLFNSVFPDSELVKERNVVIEEIKRDTDAPGSAADDFFTQKAYAGTDYSRPVLGYKAFIENIPRAAVVAYWKKYYVPSNMTAMIIGDFEPSEMKRTVASILGDIPAALSGTPTETRPVTTGDVLTGQHRFDTAAAVTSTYVNFSFAAPPFGDSAYLPFDLLTQYLSLDEVSPLLKALKGGADPLATEVSVSLGTYDGFSRLDISAISEKSDNSDSICRLIISTVERLAELEPDEQALAGIKTSLLCEEIYNSEKLHYYGFMIAPRLMTAGWSFIQQYPELLSHVTWAECRMAARNWLSKPNYIATVVRPPRDSAEPQYTPTGLTAEQVTEHFAKVSFPEFDLTTGVPLVIPSTESVGLEYTDRSQYCREALPNGLTVIVKSNPDSRVFAVDVLGRDRSANEPPDKTGISDFVNRCLEKGTLTRSAAELSTALSRIGANLTLYDNPFIPYDDRYTTPQFTFVKFETIDTFAREGFALLSELLLRPSFDSVEVEKVRKGMLGTLMREAGSPGPVARGLYYRTMFGDGAYAHPIMGTPETINSISVDDLRKYHAHFYAPNNTVLVATTNLDTAAVMGWVRESFGALPRDAAPYVRPAAPVDVDTTRTAHTDLSKAQMSIYLGRPLPGATSDEAVALEVATSILSDRLYNTLREKQGLAYSVGASIMLDSAFGWYTCSMGTGADKYEQAIAGILLQIDKLRLDGPSTDEVRKARNQIWGRLMSAKLSRINQSYYLAVDEYLGRRPGHDADYVRELAQVTPQSVQQVMSKYFRTDAYVLATAGKKQP
ncbi:MAG: pitrilysin family protein [Candidatus Zixiibacteriota bacterium]